MSGLIKYEAARLALAECKTFDEAKSWADKAAAMQAYGRMAKDKTMEIDAAEIRLRAERRLGEMLIEQKETGGLNVGGNPKLTGRDKRPVEIPTLADAGISKDLSSRAQKYAAVPAKEFEAIVEDWREKVSEEGVRVSLQLQAVGESAGKKKPVVSEPEEQNYDDGAPDETELRQAELEERGYQEFIEKVFADEPSLAAALEENKRLNAELATVKISRDGYMNQCNAYIKQIKSLQRKLEKAGVQV